MERKKKRTYLAQSRGHVQISLDAQVLHQKGTIRFPTATFLSTCSRGPATSGTNTWFLFSSVIGAIVIWAGDAVIGVAKRRGLIVM